MGKILVMEECDPRFAELDELIAQERARQGGAHPLNVINPGVKQHGVVSAYTNYGCRCGPCRDAERLYRAKLRRHARSTIR